MAAVLYLIDGYNVTRSDPATRDLPLEAQRAALVRRLETRGRVLLGSGRIVVVFDALDGDIGHDEAPGPSVQVVFSRGQIADDEIVRIASKAAETVVVVSDDRELGARACTHAAHGCEVRAASTCHQQAVGSRRRRSRVARETGLPSGANKITEELKNLWLSDEER